MEKINIVQFLPYYPPHKGGLETHAMQWADKWSINGYGKIINITTNIGTKYEGKNKVFMEKKNGVIIYFLPSIEIIYNFPIYKIWLKEVRNILKMLLKKDVLVITRTRFFLTSFIGGVFSRKYEKRWVHIEHGSDYVKLNSNFKNLIAKMYDKLIGKWILKKVDLVIPISNACNNFIIKLGGKKVKIGEVIYRGVNLIDNNFKKHGELKFVFIGRLVKLKGVDYLLDVYKNLNSNIELNIIGDGEERQNLKKFVKENKLTNVKFLGFKNKEFIENFLAKNNCILINSSYQEGLPTTVIEGLFYENVVVASNVGGTAEISNKQDLILFEAGNKDDLTNKIDYAIKYYKKINGKSKKIILKKFDWDKNILDYYNLLKNAKSNFYR